ncbi:MAG: SMC-Scp complex subunit ScpB [Gammaproteobacteria bacterium]|nr:SMC-Scp complex subunit ScpB [Gammaproteobacteria bacterium]
MTESYTQIETPLLKRILEAALLAAGKPLSLKRLLALFPEDQPQPSADQVTRALAEIRASLSERGMELKQVASGYRLQVPEELAPWVARLWEEKPPRYSRALLETLALIVYRQPVTRAEIEEVRGVSVSSQIIKTLQEREWIKILGYKDVPGKPAMFGTTRVLLDYFNVGSLDEMPTLKDLQDLDRVQAELELVAQPADPVSETPQETN